MTPAESLRAKAKTYRVDAQSFRHCPDMVDGTGGLSATAWVRAFEQIARELDRCADEIEEGR